MRSQKCARLDLAIVKESRNSSRRQTNGRGINPRQRKVCCGRLWVGFDPGNSLTFAACYQLDNPALNMREPRADIIPRFARRRKQVERLRAPSARVCDDVFWTIWFDLRRAYLAAKIPRRGDRREMDLEAGKPADNRVRRLMHGYHGQHAARAGRGYLSLSEIKSEHSDGVIRRELESEECVRWLEQRVGPAHPCLGKVCSRAVVIGHIRKEEVTQVSFAEDDDMVKTFPSDRANQPFRMAILPWRSRRGGPITNAHGAKPPLEYFAVDTVAIADDVPWHRLPAPGLGKLPGDPFSRRMRRHAQP
jgi:hypothetical protein